VVLTTDHPNGGPFTSYPHLIRLLMDRSFRNEQLARLHPEVAANAALRSITRELSLSEIATMTRAGTGPAARPAGPRAAGCRRGGRHRALPRRRRPRGDVTTPEQVFKDGRLVARAGRITAVPVGGTHFIEPGLRPRHRDDTAQALCRPWAAELRPCRDRPRRVVPVLQRRPPAADGVLRWAGHVIRNGVTIDDTSPRPSR